MRPSIFVVCALTAFVLGAIALSDAFAGPEQDCISCHGVQRTEGGYLFEPPDLSVIVPENVSAGETFQVLVVVSVPYDYDLVAPKAYIDGPDPSGPSSDVADLHRNGTIWSGTLRVRAGDAGGEAIIRVEYSVHHDHADPQYADVATYGLERSLWIDGPSDEVPDRDVPKDTPLGLMPLIAGPASFLWWRLWKAERKLR